MKEIIEEALVKFGLNRIILEKEKEEVIKIFSIPEDQNILLISENKDCTLVITDFAIYFQINNTNENVTDLATSILTIGGSLVGGSLVGIGLGLGKKVVKSVGDTLLKKKLAPILWNKIVSIEEEKIKKDDRQFSKLIFKIEGENENIKILFSSSIFYELFYYIHTENKNNSQAIPVIEKIRQLLAQNNIQEAQMFLRSVKINEKSPYYKEYLSLSAEIYKKNNNFYKAAQAYDDLRSLNKGNLESFSQYGREKQNNYNNYLTHFKELPLRERNIITISNTDKLFKSDHITLLNIEQLPAINFPSSHPKPNQTYIAHPYKTDIYLPIESYDYELLNDRMDEFFRILGCLGATSITLKTIKKENKEEKKNLKIEGNVGGSKEGIELDIDAKYSKAASTSLSKYMDMERSQTFAPNKRPYIPKDTIWFPREPRWQRLAQQRLEGGILTYTERISSSENQLLNKKQIATIGAELKTLLYSIKAEGLYEKEENLQQNEEFSFLLEIEFKSMKEFPEETDIIDITAEEIIQTPVQLPTPNDNEARYLEEIHFMLEDDGQIDNRERTILERFRERYNITPERAKELEAQAIVGQELTSEEQEYLSEYRNSLHDGAISEKERRLLDRLAMALGISEERVTEIEKLI